nr:hypothetical protein BaRGS_033618 [Batillaria attramentaria]KAG5707662.1 hypothetical protein BaRGS_031044 [Batillaria attramentaria]KAG5714240.1 hypothetical protein BaRGS_018457 [Batillaria attramentaria]
MVFSDECRFVVNSIDNRVRVWRPRGERFNNRYVLQQDAWPAQSMMLWGAFIGNRMLGPVFFDLQPDRGGGVTSQRYINQVLQPLVELRRQWGRVPPAFLNRLVNSMPNRCQLVIRNAGGHTRY